MSVDRVKIVLPLFCISDHRLLSPQTPRPACKQEGQFENIEELNISPEPQLDALDGGLRDHRPVAALLSDQDINF